MLKEIHKLMSRKSGFLLSNPVFKHRNLITSIFVVGSEQFALANDIIEIHEIDRLAKSPLVLCCNKLEMKFYCMIGQFYFQSVVLKTFLATN